ncbi:MAG: Lon protease-like protein, partial [Ilumatobacter sp.]
MAVIPMFPLGMVLLPGGILPLHVFEPRYRQMVVDCLRQDGEPEFGQALITHGSEAGGGDERAMVGTIAQMIKVEALDEERYSMVTVGTRRIRV